MPFTMRRRSALAFATRAALAVGLGLLLGFAAPFSGRPPLDAPVRYAFWVGMTLTGYLAALATHRLLTESLSARPHLRLAGAAAVSAVPMTFVAAWVIPLIRPGHAYGPAQLPVLFGIVALVQCVIAGVLLRRSSPCDAPAGHAADDCPVPASFPPALLSRLPERLGRDVVALQSEDHYLRIHTDRGSHLVLMRLSDAIALIDPNLGLQVHRSWWVADAGIVSVVQSPQRIELRLSNGLRVPVGRTYTSVARSRVGRFRVPVTPRDERARNPSAEQGGTKVEVNSR